MSEKPSFVRCPYCRRKLDKTPKRKTACPYCDKPIYVRGGKLLREDALEAAAAKPAKKPTAKKPASGSAKKPAKSKPKPKPQGQLGADLKKKREKYSQKDLLAGLQLLIPIVGALFASGGLGSLLGSLFGGGGANATRSEAGVASALQSVDIDELLTAAANAYDSFDDEQKFQMRAVVTWVQNGFQLPEEAGA
ncbi:MAG: hypothetical protein BroJett021_45730 [Chloroflexota bacterium]|nr:MAG: hypothetical protein BroJett021_45730 [Chloroflexota bacterium]